MIAAPRCLALVGGAILLTSICACSGSTATSSHDVSSQGVKGSQVTPSRTAPASSPIAPKTSPPRPNPPATEFNPPGDIPDNQVYVAYRTPGTRVQIRVPEGWARGSGSAGITFTDNYNSVAIHVVRTAKAPSVSSASHIDVPLLRRAVAKFAAGQVTMVQRHYGSAVLITYFEDSAPNSVTGKVVRDAVERYEFWHDGQEAVLTLTGPKGADNVDPWRLVSDSLTWL